MYSFSTGKKTILKKSSDCQSVQKNILGFCWKLISKNLSVIAVMSAFILLKLFLPRFFCYFGSNLATISLYSKKFERNSSPLPYFKEPLFIIFLWCYIFSSLKVYSITVCLSQQSKIQPASIEKLKNKPTSIKLLFAKFVLDQKSATSQWLESKTCPDSQNQKMFSWKVLHSRFEDYV